MSDKSIPEIGEWGYYHSPKGKDSPKDGKPCQIHSLNPSPILKFKDPRFGFDSVHMGVFTPDPSAQFAA